MAHVLLFMADMLESLFASSNYQAANVMMDVSAIRHQALAGNLANVETPGYRRVDIDPSFKAALSESVKAGEVTEIQRFGTPEVAEVRGLKAVRSDGNNVSLDRELMYINQNALEYQAMGQFVSSSLNRLKMAITGQAQ